MKGVACRGDFWSRPMIAAIAPLLGTIPPILGAIVPVPRDILASTCIAVPVLGDAVLGLGVGKSLLSAVIQCAAAVLLVLTATLRTLIAVLQTLSNMLVAFGQASGFVDGLTFDANFLGLLELSRRATSRLAALGMLLVAGRVLRIR